MLLALRAWLGRLSPADQWLAKQTVSVACIERVRWLAIRQEMR